MHDGLSWVVLENQLLRSHTKIEVSVFLGIFLFAAKGKI
jgi:hypothetical protein